MRKKGRQEGKEEARSLPLRFFCSPAATVLVYFLLILIIFVFLKFNFFDPSPVIGL